MLGVSVAKKVAQVLCSNDNVTQNWEVANGKKNR